MKKNKKLVALICCMALLIGAVGATLAWLTDSEGPITNIFTTSDLEMDLTETNQPYKMIPGFTIDKDPTAIITAESEPCMLFVKVVEEGVAGTYTDVGGTEQTVDYAFSDYITYAMAAGWEAGTGESGNGVPVGVFFREVANADDPATEINEARNTLIANVEIPVIGYDADPTETVNFINNKVLVKDTVTKEMMEAARKIGEPKLTFTAYAVQLYKSNDAKFSAAEAWTKVTP